MDQLRGQDLKRAFAEATQCLGEHRDAVNALNVFPVPDGDTGTNMFLTMRSAVQEAERACPGGRYYSVAAVSSALAQGAFFGARGNSGVILSQFFKGFSDALDGKESLAAPDLALAFKMASEASYRSVGEPVEGTMLTVVRMASEAVAGAVSMPAGSGSDGPAGDLLDLWKSAFQASQDALDQTPQQLPVLKEAGVVDAGGLGIVVLLGGVLRSLYGDGPPGVDLSALSRYYGALNEGFSGGLVKTGYLETASEQDWGYCTQFIISGTGLDPDQVRDHFQETALSTVVAGDSRHLRVHVHVEDTGPALSYAESLGVLSEISIENMDNQAHGFATTPALVQPKTGQPEGSPLALLPVTRGKGLAQLFLDLGCAAVIEGGQTMNPSVQQILEAARGTRAKDVIVLPNNGNVVLAAEQAAAAESSIHVVPTRNVPQGVAALLAFNPEDEWQANINAMTAALAQVASVEVTTAVRGVEIGGVEIIEGRSIGLLEGRVVAAEDTPESALRAALDQAGLSSGAIVTIYYGAGGQASAAESVAASLETGFPGIQVDLVDGGQPNYQYLASVE